MAKSDEFNKDKLDLDNLDGQNNVIPEGDNLEAESPGENPVGDNMDGKNPGGDPPGSETPKGLNSSKKTPKKDGKIRQTLLSRFDWLNRFKHWYMGGISLIRSLFRVHAAKQTIFLIGGALTICYIMAAFYTQSGEFVVKIDRAMARDGFYLSEIPNFDERLITLHAPAKTDATNVNVYDLSDDVMDVDGEHHGPDYFAYTFYVKNLTGETKDYRYTLFVRHQTKGLEKAAWIMVFHNGEQEIFAQPSANGGAEVQFSDHDFPFLEYAKYPEEQQTIISGAELNKIPADVVDRLGLQGLQSVHQLNTVPFESAMTVCSGLRPGFEHDGMDKFTVVIWAEGEDPECLDDIIGGEIELAMSFTY